jgi:hypothetical protein
VTLLLGIISPEDQEKMSEGLTNNKHICIDWISENPAFMEI